MRCRPPSERAWHPGVGTLTWLAFVPFALVIGGVSEQVGIGRTGWVFVAVGVAAAALMLVVLPRARPCRRRDRPSSTSRRRRSKPVAFPPDRFVPPDDPAWPGHWATPPAAWTALGMPVDGPEALEHARAAIADLPPDPAAGHRPPRRRGTVGRSRSAGRSSISPEEERGAIQQARSLVRARLEQHFEGTGATT